MVYQNPEDMFIKDSIEKDIAYAMEARGVPDAAGRTDRLLERFRLSGLRDRDGRLLSGGQMRRASLAIGGSAGPGHPAAGRAHRQPGYCHPKGDHAHP